MKLKEEYWADVFVCENENCPHLKKLSLNIKTFKEEIGLKWEIPVPRCYLPGNKYHNPVNNAKGKTYSIQPDCYFCGTPMTKTGEIKKEVPQATPAQCAAMENLIVDRIQKSDDPEQLLKDLESDKPFVKL